jgi:hypothetical protein
MKLVHNNFYSFNKWKESSNDKENEYSVVTVPSQHENTNTNTDTESASHWTLSDRHFLTFLNYNKCLGIDESMSFLFLSFSFYKVSISSSNTYHCQCRTERVQPFDSCCSKFSIRLEMEPWVSLIAIFYSKQSHRSCDGRLL